MGGMTAASPPVDGRTARAQRTRQAVVDALIALVQAGDPRPRVQAIAERAGVSTRAVHLHFRTVHELHLALVERTTELVIERLAVIDPDEPLDVRVDLLTAQRARINEELGALLRAADGFEQTSAPIAEGRVFGRRSSRDQLERIFARELRHLPAGARARVVAAVDALLTHQSWNLMRVTHGLSPDEARIATGDAATGLLAPPRPR
jgi:AcrR family transcriptional regulator